MLGLLTVLALSVQQTDPEVLPPPPTEAEMLAAFEEDRPGARVITHETQAIFGGRSKICGTAEIAGQLEPFAVIPEEGSRTSAVATLAGQQPPAQTPGLRPRHWRINTVSPGAWNFVENSQSDPRVQGLDAFNRSIVLRYCPALQPPPGVTWRTEIEQD